MGSNPPPPSATRLRSNQARLDSITNAAFCMVTAVSSSQCRAAAGMPSQAGSGSLGHFMNLSLLGENSVDSVPEESKAGAKWSRAHLQGAMQQVDQLQADIAGMEAVVAAVRGVHPDMYTLLVARIPILGSALF